MKSIAVGIESFRLRFFVLLILVFAAGIASAKADCLLYTSDAADDLLCVDLGGRRIIKKKKQYS